MKLQKHQWILDFYNLGRINLPQIEISEEPPQRRPLLGKMLNLYQKASAGRYPIILPFMDSNRDLSIYVLEKNLRYTKESLAELKAFLGSSRTTTLTGVIQEAENGWEELIQKTTPHGWLKIVIQPAYAMKSGAWEETLETLTIFQELREHRPKLSEVNARPIGRVLRDFYSAIHNLDIKGAQDFLLEAKITNALTNTNFGYLEIIALAAANRWRDILDHRSLHDLIRSRLPLPVFEAILRSVHNVLLSVATKSPEGLEGCERVDIQANTPELVGVFTGFPHEKIATLDKELIRTWVIAAAAYNNPLWIEIANENLSTAWTDAISTWAGITLKPTPITPNTQLVESIDDVVGLIGEYFIAPPARQFEIRETLSVRQELMSHVLLERPYLSERIRSSGLFHDQDEVSVDDWNSVFCSILGGDNDLSLQTTVQNNWQEWDTAAINETTLATYLDDLINEGDNEKTELLRNITPLFINSLEHNNTVISASLCLRFCWALSLDDASSREDITLGYRLAERFFLTSYTPAQYEELLTNLSEVWGKTASVSSLSQALDLVDLLVDNHISSETSLLQFWNSVQLEGLRSWERLSADIKLAIRELALAICHSEQHLPTEIVEEDAEGLTFDLSGKTLAIYTLMKGSAHRARTILMKLFKGLNVELNHDKVSTQALEQLTRRADYFVFASGRAKHAAFYAVTGSRRDLIYPSGNGSTSIVRSFLQRIECD